MPDTVTERLNDAVSVNPIAQTDAVVHVTPGHVAFHFHIHKYMRRITPLRDASRLIAASRSASGPSRLRESGRPAPNRVLGRRPAGLLVMPSYSIPPALAAAAARHATRHHAHTDTSRRRVAAADRFAMVATGC